MAAVQSQLDALAYDEAAHAQARATMAALREVGASLVRSFSGRPAELIALADGDAVRLVDLIVRSFPSFDDRAAFRGARVAFLKRAQLVPAMLHARFGGRGWGRLAHVDRFVFVVPAAYDLVGRFSCSPQAVARRLEEELERSGEE